MFTLKRITTVPNSPLRVMVDQPSEGDAGLAQGGSFWFMPAGQDGDTAAVSEVAARAIMGDPGLAAHFQCTPPWPPVQKQDLADAEAEAPAADTKRSRR